LTKLLKLQVHIVSKSKILNTNWDFRLLRCWPTVYCYGVTVLDCYGADLLYTFAKLKKLGYAILSYQGIW